LMACEPAREATLKIHLEIVMKRTNKIEKG